MRTSSGHVTDASLRRLVNDGALDGEIWLDAEVGINRADFGLTWNVLGMAAMDNTLTVHAVFSR